MGASTVQSSRDYNLMIGIVTSSIPHFPLIFDNSVLQNFNIPKGAHGSAAAEY